MQWMENTGPAAPWLFLAMFMAASFLLIWRLEAMSAGGLEGTVLGTLIMPYCTGIGNLIAAFVLEKQGGSGKEVMTMCIVNNVTNMTLLIGLPTVIWGMNVLPKPARDGKTGKKKTNNKASELNRLSLLLTLVAVLFFTGAVWALGHDSQLDRNDGLVLVGIFIFWQCFHVFDVLKSNVSKNKSIGWMFPVDLLLLAIGAYATYLSIDWLVKWIEMPAHTGFISAKYVGWLTGWLNVIPNALLAFYYAWKRKPEVVYTSQVGDGHICIPLCVGIFALYHTFTMPAVFQAGMWILCGACAVHIVFVALFGRLPRFVGLALVIAYGVFLYKGLIG